MLGACSGVRQRVTKNVMGAQRNALIAVFLLATAAPNGAAQERVNRQGLSLQQTFDIYVRAIHECDLEALMSTVTAGPDIVFLTTNGRVIHSPAGYRQFHVDWFAEEGWTIEFDVQQLREGAEYGYVLTRYHYEGLDPGGKPYESDSYFTLIFHIEDGMWKVVHDQITPIRGASG